LYGETIKTPFKKKLESRGTFEILNSFYVGFMLNEGQFDPSLSIEGNKKQKHKMNKLSLVAKNLKLVSRSFSSFHKGFLVIM
jgi:hypothetical protein